MNGSIHTAISALVEYGIRKGLLAEADRTCTINQILDILHLTDFEPAEVPAGDIALTEVLDTLTDYAAEHGLLQSEGITGRDLFDTKLMGALTPRPSAVIRTFRDLYETEGPEAATDWFYRFCKDVNYIRAERVKRDVRWTVESEYGTLDITINLSKPEKDPRDIAAARTKTQSAYPKCQLCMENEGYAGRLDHPARQNHRIIPITINGSQWGFQYSPYVYYNEHCIALNSAHVPMKIDRAAFRKLFDFVEQFPHYFLGSNADLPIVGGSILTHDHFQGGHYEFAMARAGVESTFTVPGFDDMEAGIVHWPLSVIRLRGKDTDRIVDLADHILRKWRSYTDEEAFILAETDGEPHNTITPIARKNGDVFELDLTLRNNMTTDEFPLGVYHPHPEYHHIKKENIGLIEVMGLAVLPSRLKTEMTALADVMTGPGLPAPGASVPGHPELDQHLDWAHQVAEDHPDLSADNAEEILRQEIGRVFTGVLEDAGVYKCTDEGRAAFRRFLGIL